MKAAQHNRKLFFVISCSVPKAVMHNMVNHVKQHLQSELVGQLYVSDKIARLLTESPHVKRKRDDAQNMLTALQLAAHTIHDIGASAIF